MVVYTKLKNFFFKINLASVHYVQHNQYHLSQAPFKRQPFVQLFFHVGVFFFFLGEGQQLLKNVISEVQNSKRLVNVRWSRALLFTW